MKTAGDILAVVGGQYGSEGKGVIVAHLANDYNVHVRVGGPNAGHSFVFQDKVYKMQSLPCGWINPNAMLILARGALVDFAQLKHEVALAEAVMPGIKNRLLIDAKAAVLDQRHHDEEGGVHGELHGRIGSTGHGVGAARMARLARDPSKIKLAEQVASSYGFGTCIIECASEMIVYQSGFGNVLLEGTQGSGLSLIHGPWPYVTSADTNAAQMAVDCGIPPRRINRTLLVVRSYPIRVAGNSGPLKNEITWNDLSARLGKPVLEQTTVTKKIRRVGEWDEELFLKGVNLNDPTSIAFTFADYVNPADEGKEYFHLLSPKTQAFVAYLEQTSGVPVSLISTGGEGWKVINRGITP